MKKVLIVGGGISGVFASIRIKENYPDYEVVIFEHNDKLLKKIYATGNGKCNFANVGELRGKYHNEQFALNIINSFNAEDIINYFRWIGIESKQVGNLVYPYSESAETVAIKLLNRLNKLGVNVHLNEDVLDYSKEYLKTNKDKYPYDYLVFSTGGCSSPNLGSTGSLFDVFIKHGYEITRLSPSLCPIVTKENTKMIEGLRHKAVVNLYHHHSLIHQEEGEVLFKKDGLSGMVIFNMTHFINDLPDLDEVTLHIDFARNIDGDYDSLVHPKLAAYLIKKELDIHDTVFTFKKFYDYSNSQVTSGGISISNLNDDLSSKLEEKVYFIGEVVDVNAVCGGYNIMWALSSADRASK